MTYDTHRREEYAKLKARRDEFVTELKAALALHYVVPVPTSVTYITDRFSFRRKDTNKSDYYSNTEVMMRPAARANSKMSVTLRRDYVRGTTVFPERKDRAAWVDAVATAIVTNLREQDARREYAASAVEKYKQRVPLATAYVKKLLPDCRIEPHDQSCGEPAFSVRPKKKREPYDNALFDVTVRFNQSEKIDGYFVKGSFHFNSTTLDDESVRTLARVLG